jgi:hypothetical protein
MDKQKDLDEFVPVGAIAFFVALLLFFALVWFGFYALMVVRS